MQPTIRDWLARFFYNGDPYNPDTTCWRQHGETKWHHPLSVSDSIFRGILALLLLWWAIIPIVLLFEALQRLVGESGPISSVLEEPEWWAERFGSKGVT